MARLVINAGTPDAWEIELQHGVHVLGRNPGSDLTLDHPSVSDAHCEITVQDSIVSLKDLGSATGTFVDDAPLTEARLRHGQAIRLGEILCRFETDSEMQTPAPARDEPAAQPQYCKLHPRAVGQYRCPHCETFLCELCVSRRRDAGMVRPFCRACGSECTPLNVRIAAVPQAEKPFFKQVPRAFIYPFEADGLILLVGGTIVYSIINWLLELPLLLPLLGLVLMALATPYLIGYYQRILVSSANGEDKMPDWPDLGNLSELTAPILQFIATFAVSFGPAIAVVLFAPASTWTAVAFWMMAVLGCLFFPIAFMAVSMADTVTALNPLVLIRSIFRIFGHYILTALLLGVIIVASWAGSGALELVKIPLIPELLSQFVGLYFATVEMRLLGLLYRCKKRELRWFGR